MKKWGNFVMKREIRDPIYDYIHLTAIENEVVDSWIFQRLDGLTQMPTAHLVYPSGKYSRKTHSLGTMHLMSKALLHVLYTHSRTVRERISPLLFGEPVVFKGRANLDHLDQRVNTWWNSKEIDEIVQYARLAALLHDIGHAPFSHTFEDLAKELAQRKIIEKEFDHEEMSRRIIEEKEDEIGMKRIFEAKEINSILDKKGNAPDFLKELINGPYDCDKLDYLTRDSYHAGTPEYGKLDDERIIDGFRVIGFRLCISSSALHAVMNSFRSVQSMYAAVYYHRVSRAFDFMIADAFSMVPEFITEITSSVDEFLKYDDHTFLGEIKERAKKENSSGKSYKKAMEMLKMVRYRQKRYVCILEFPLNFPLVVKRNPQKDLREICTTIEEISRNCGAEDLKVRIDHKPTICPIGIDLEDITNWLKVDMIYDTKDDRTKSLEEIFRAYFQDLLHYSILFRIFVDRKKSKEYSHVVKKIKREAENELVKLEIRLSAPPPSS